MLKKTLFATAALAMAATASNASIVAYAPTVMEIPQPAHVTNSDPANDKFILAFNEKQRFTLASDLTIDGGTIAAGTVVDSHMVLFNKEGSTPLTLHQSGWLSFSGMILGVISFQKTLLASDFLGAPSIYDDFKNRGLDEGKLDSYGFAGDTLTAEFFVNRPGDWIRVISVADVPVPAAAAFLPMGFAALVGLRRRRKAAKLA
jgi:hypothetical protein